MSLWKLSATAEKDFVPMDVHILSREKELLLRQAGEVQLTKLFNREFESLGDELNFLERMVEFACRGEAYLKMGGVANGGTRYATLPISKDFSVHVDVSANSPSMSFFRLLQRDSSSFKAGEFYGLARSGMIPSVTYICPELLGEIKKFPLDKFLKNNYAKCN